MPILEKENLEQLNKYQYHGGAYTWLDNKLNPFWFWCCEKTPLWVAPNLITFTGFLLVFIGVLSLVIIDTSGSQYIPNFIFIYCGVATWIYQTLDCVDGKQARRTNSASPLGQLFDHGCDAFMISILITIANEQLLLPVYLKYSFLAILNLFCFAANWIEHQSGILHTQVGGYFGVTEGTYLTLTSFLLTGIFGQQFWQSMKIANISVHIFIIVGLISLIAIILVKITISQILTVQNKTNAILQWVSIVLIQIVVFFYFIHPDFQNYINLITLSFGILSSLIICKLIIATVTKVKFDVFHKEAILPTLIIIIVYATQNNLSSFYKTILLFISLISIWISTLKYLYQIINEITAFLNIYCFSLKKRVPLKEN